MNRVNRSSDEEVMIEIRSSVPSLEGDRSAQNVETGISLIRDLRLEGDRSAQNVETGPSMIRDLWLEGDWSAENVETGSSLVRDLRFRKRPVCAKQGDRSPPQNSQKMSFLSLNEG